MKTMLLAIIALLASHSVLSADEVDYTRDIKPLLEEKCAACHGALRQESGLRLDAGVLIHKGGDGGPVIDAEKPLESSLLERVGTEDKDFLMPPPGEGEALTEAQLKLFQSWLQAGAPSPAEETIPPAPESHWAYQRPQKAPLPTHAEARWNQNPIDQLLHQERIQRQLKPAPLADPRTLLRRIYLDMIGLSPTREQQQAFLAAATDTTSANAAWEKVVEDLLADPAYGERWGRHWMDVWRYSDWEGYKQALRGSQRHIWHWRDWIINSLNADKGYDQMIVEMLAGDELAPEDRDVLVATGFLARNFHVSNRDIWLDSTVEHTAKAFLGMTINCARCHDHKFDPISQTEYYQFRAIFEPHQVRTERVPGQPNLNTDGLVRVYDAKLDEPTYLYQAGNEKAPDKENPLAPEVPQILSLPYEPKAVSLPELAVFPSLNSFIEQEELAQAEAKLTKAEAELTQWSSKETEEEAEKELAHLIAEQAHRRAVAELAALKARWAADKAKFQGEHPEAVKQKLAQAAIKAEWLSEQETVRHELLVHQQQLSKAQNSQEEDEKKKVAAIKKADEALKKIQEQHDQLTAQPEPPADKKYTPVGKNYPTKSSGRRLALARWITDPQNPLTARVAINHLWLRHFGEPLVENVFDFGLKTPVPPQAALLDWLAVELIEQNWSMKHIHRLILNSQTYRMASSVSVEQQQAGAAVDPDNHYYWKMNPRRLDAEIVRDQILHVAGKLDLTRGGPDIDYALGEKTPRRSLYFRHAYEKQMTMLVIFDAAGPMECYQRSESIIPQQALVLSNSPLAIENSRLLAQKLTAGVSENSDFIQQAYETLLCRPASAAELTACQSFLQQQTELLTRQEQLTLIPGSVSTQVEPAASPELRARENLIHVLINHNDFVTIR